jgi:error-prone DNA polymerase
MSMLPRLRPRCFYDLVIEVAIVRPGPIQGGMVHPYLRRRDGREPIEYPSAAVRQVLEKTLGVPIFQEQVMRLAVVAAGFTPGEADQLRRAMAAWRRSGQIHTFQIRLVRGLLANGYSRDFAEQLYRQIQGFAEYGFPESHAASFALLVYASAWLKRHHPAAFCAAMLNSQPLGFYTPGQLIRDAIAHGVTVRPVDVARSEWDCTLETDIDPARERSPAVRLGFRMISGLSEAKVRGVALRRRCGLPSPAHLARGVARDTLLRLAAADAFRSQGLAGDTRPRSSAASPVRPLLEDAAVDEPPVCLPRAPLEEDVLRDYEAQGFSLHAHPLELVRARLDALARRPRVLRAAELRYARNGRAAAVAGLVTCRQRPATASGVVFMTLEDETGLANLIIRPDVWQREWRVAKTAAAIVAQGTVERQGEVVHVMVRRLRELREALRGADSPAAGELLFGAKAPHRSRDFH